VHSPITIDPVESENQQLKNLTARTGWRPDHRGAGAAFEPRGEILSAAKDGQQDLVDLVGIEPTTSPARPGRA